MIKSEFMARLEIFPFVKDYYSSSLCGNDKTYHLCHNFKLEEYSVFYLENGAPSRKESFSSADEAYEYLWNVSIGDDMAIEIRNNPEKYGLTNADVKYKFRLTPIEIFIGVIALLFLALTIVFSVLATNNSLYSLTILFVSLAFVIVSVVLIDTIIKHRKTTKRILYAINRRAALLYPRTIPDKVVNDLDKGYLREYFKKDISSGFIRDFDVVWDGQAFAVIFNCNKYDICLEEESLVITLDDGTVEKEVFYSQINNPDNSTRLIYERVIKEINLLTRKEQSLAEKTEENKENAK